MKDTTHHPMNPDDQIRDAIAQYNQLCLDINLGHKELLSLREQLDKRDTFDRRVHNKMIAQHKANNDAWAERAKVAGEIAHLISDCAEKSGPTLYCDIDGDRVMAVWCANKEWDLFIRPLKDDETPTYRPTEPDPAPSRQITLAQMLKDYLRYNVALRTAQAELEHKRESIEHWQDRVDDLELKLPQIQKHLMEQVRSLLPPDDTVAGLYELEGDYFFISDEGKCNFTGSPKLQAESLTVEVMPGCTKSFLDLV